MKIKFPKGAKHYANTHFPGLYSVVLDNKDGLLTRAYIARPGEIHRNLSDTNGVFLYHAHAYDITEGTIYGTITNVLIEPDPKGKLFHQYKITGGIGDGPIRLRKVGFMKMLEYGVFTGKVFTLSHHVIHRVCFHADPITGWFCAIVRELERYAKPSIVYSPHLLTKVPDVDILYKNLSNRDAEKLIRSMPDKGSGILSTMDKGQWSA